MIKPVYTVLILKVVVVHCCTIILLQFNSSHLFDHIVYTMSANRVVLMTGATGSIGQSIANGLASYPSTTLILALRNIDKGNQVKQQVIQATNNSDIHIEQVELDSSSSIKQLCDRIQSKYGVLNVLMNNAAATAPNNKQYTKDHIELQFGVNVYAYYLLSELLVPVLKKGAQTQYGARIVNVASHYAGELDINDIEFNQRAYSESSAYKQSKQADRMMTWQLAEKYKPYNINCYSCHPGMC